MWWCIGNWVLYSKMLLHLHHKSSDLFFHPANFDNFKVEKISNFQTVWFLLHKENFIHSTYPLGPLPATYYCQRKRKLTIISFFYGWHQKKLWWSSNKQQPTHWTFVTPFHFMLVGYKNYLYCFALYIQKLIGHSFYTLCWNCHMWIFFPLILFCWVLWENDMY
jgi:hypothetical protein